MANYGLKYQCTFDPPSGGSVFFKPRYRLEILQKEYVGAASNVKGGSVPVLHSWQTDDPKAPVRGSSLTINLLNEGSIPLTAFYSIADDEFKVRLYWLEVGLLVQTTDRLLFEGFLVQDDCTEPLVDFDHEITLSANDNLGLLKDVKLNEAPANWEPYILSTETYEITYSGSQAILLVSIPFGSEIQVGDKITIDGGTPYTVTSLYLGGSVYNVYLAQSPATVSTTTGDILISRFTLLDKLPLLSIIKRCISATTLELDTNIYCNLLEVNNVDTSSFLDQVLIDTQTFLIDDTNYKDCYSILEEILGRFNLSLFQAEGVWNIVRWDELRYYSNLIPGYNYDSKMTLVGPVTLPDPFTAEPFDPASPPEMYPTYQLFNKIFRAFKYDKETFYYKQPPQLLRNYNLQQLGTPITSTTTGSGSTLQTITDYETPWWTPGFTWTSGGGGLLTSSIRPMIRVVVDNVGNEIGRYLVVKGNPVADLPSAVASYKIEVNAGDSIKLSFDFRTSHSQPGPSNIIFDFNLITQLPLAPIGPNNKYLDDDGTWDATRNFVYNVPTGENLNEWHTVEVTSDQIPFDGLLYIKLAQASFSFQETHYRDIRLEYIPTINQSTKIKGHTHKAEQIPDPKNKEDIEILLDTSPRNSVVGTLFLPTLTGILQALTTKWRRGHLTESRNLGDITTTETLFYRRLSRSILEGSFVGLLHDNKHRHISALSVIKYDTPATTDLNFVPGRFEIDYKNDLVNNSPLHEIWKDGETDADLTSDYEYKYLYETK